MGSNLLRLLVLVFPIYLGQAPAQSIKSARAWMGVAIDQGKKGVLIKSVMEKTPAMKAGFLAGDEVLSIDSVVVRSPKEMIDTIAAKGVGVSVKVKFLRNDKEQEKTFNLEARPDMDSLQKTQLMNLPAPDFKLPVVYGKSGNLADLKGQVVLLKFWATWCPACKAALPYVAAISEKHKGKIKVVTIMNEEESVIKGFFKGKPPPPFEVLRDPKGAISSKYYVPALPTFVVLDKEAVVRHTGIGGGIYLKEALEAALKLTEGSPSPKASPQ